MLAVFIRSPRLIKGANGSHEVRFVPPRSCGPPRVGLATRLCDFATNRREKRGRHHELTCCGHDEIARYLYFKDLNAFAYCRPGSQV